jgi:hypothetical protein
MTYTPVLTDEKYGRWTFEVQPHKCPICNKWMMTIIERDSPFPAYWEDNQAAQMKRAGIVPVGAFSIIHDGYICAECVEADRGTFTCALCGEERSIRLAHKNHLYRDEALCVVCYDTRPAKEWVEAVSALDERHRWDYE